MNEENGAETRRGPGRPPNPHRVEEAARAEAARQAAEAAEQMPTRRIRAPFGSQVQKLSLKPREGFHRHWINDEPGRIAQALKGGWTHIKDDDGSPLSRIVNPATNGRIAYAMEIRQEWYDEDMAEERKKVDDIENSIRRGQNLQASENDKQHFYASAQGRGTTISTNKSR